MQEKEIDLLYFGRGMENMYKIVFIEHKKEWNIITNNVHNQYNEQSRPIK